MNWVNIVTMSLAVALTIASGIDYIVNVSRLSAAGPEGSSPNGSGRVPGEDAEG